MRFVQSFSNDALDEVFKAITYLGDKYFFLYVLALILWCFDKEFGYRTTFLLLSTGFINNVLKEIFRVARPIGVKGIRSSIIPPPGGYSFPSGHSQAAASFWMAVMMKARRLWVYMVGSGIIFLVALSRVYLGVHWPTDVMAGIMLGILQALISDWIFEHVICHGKRVFIILIPAWIGLFVTSRADYFKLIGGLTGFILGYFIESNYMDWEVRAPIFSQIIKAILGFGIAFIIKGALKVFFPQGAIFDFIRYILIGLWITVGLPYMFAKEKRE